MRILKGVRSVKEGAVLPGSVAWPGEPLEPGRRMAHQMAVADARSREALGSGQRRVSTAMVFVMDFCRSVDASGGSRGAQGGKKNESVG